MIEAGTAYYKVTGKRTLLDVCIRMADHICDVFHRPDHLAAVPGHEEIELALVKLYEVTGQEKYLKMAKDFIDRRGQEPNYLENESKNPGWTQIFANMQDYSADVFAVGPPRAHADARGRPCCACGLSVQRDGGRGVPYAHDESLLADL
jgi:DUF1680 family protein